MRINCDCKTTYHGPSKREMLLPADMCAEHRSQYEAYHATSAAERARARAALETALPQSRSIRLRDKATPQQEQATWDDVEQGSFP